MCSSDLATHALSAPGKPVGAPRASASIPRARTADRGISRSCRRASHGKGSEARHPDGKAIFQATQSLIAIRKKLPALADEGNIRWLTPHNIHVAGMVRENAEQTIFCLFNYSSKTSYLTWFAFKESGKPAKKLFDHWTKKLLEVGADHDYLILEPYQFHILEVIESV